MLRNQHITACLSFHRNLNYPVFSVLKFLQNEKTVAGFSTIFKNGDSFQYSFNLKLHSYDVTLFFCNIILYWHDFTLYFSDIGLYFCIIKLYSFVCKLYSSVCELYFYVCKLYSCFMKYYYFCFKFTGNRLNSFGVLLCAVSFLLHRYCSSGALNKKVNCKIKWYNIII